VQGCFPTQFENGAAPVEVVPPQVAQSGPSQECLAAAQERLAAAQEFQQEQRIMSINVDKVVPWQRDYYLNLQQKIMQKHAGGSGPADL
jgi:hypothetical protein